MQCPGVNCLRDLLPPKCEGTRGGQNFWEEPWEGSCIDSCRTVTEASHRWRSQLLMTRKEDARGLKASASRFSHHLIICWCLLLCNPNWQQSGMGSLLCSLRSTSTATGQGSCGAHKWPDPEQSWTGLDEGKAALLVITAYDCHPFQLAGHGYVQDRIKDRMSTPRRWLVVPFSRQGNWVSKLLGIFEL